MNWQSQLNADRPLALLVVVFVADMVLLQWMFGTLRGGSESLYWGIIWIATILVVAMVVVALGRLFSTTTTLLGGTLAVLAILHAPLFLGMRFGLVNLSTMQTFDVVSRAIMYPLLGLVAILVLLRPLYQNYRSVSSASRQA